MSKAERTAQSPVTPAWRDDERESPAWLAALPLLSSTFAIIVGILVFGGWIFDVESLKRVVPGFVAMNPATALCFVVAGCALALAREGSSYPAVAKVLGGIVLAVGAAKLLGLAVGWHPNVDELLFASSLAPSGTSMPNRMAPNTGLIFLLLGTALLWPERASGRFSLTQGLALAAGFCALLSVTGYAYGVSAFYGLASFIPMALHTAVTSLVLAAGVLFVRTATPLTQMFATDEPRGVLARRLFPLAIVSTLGLGWVRLKGEQLGLYEPRFGTALFAITLTVVLVLLIRWALWTIGKLESEREAARRQLVESKLALEEALRQSELILNHAREIICTVDGRGQLVTVSAASEPLLGYGASTLLGRSFSELVAPDDRRAVEVAMRQTAAGLAIGSFTARCVRKDGSLAPIAWSIQYSQHSSKTYCVGREADGAAADYSVWASGR